MTLKDDRQNDTRKCQSREEGIGASKKITELTAVLESVDERREHDRRQRPESGHTQKDADRSAET
ncbi:MAG: hypothetical protein HY561_12150 [Gemmatimonadetes bacterium]|nr:hypothetical protein [Gemmatimonadota bacterium]MBI4543169.1 hypothetical protein [Gemmatimonadota bacterium]